MAAVPTAPAVVPRNRAPRGVIVLRSRGFTPLAWPMSAEGRTGTHREEHMAATCGHEGCPCEPREDGFCSDYCQKHGTREGHQAHECSCGHAGCQ